MAFNLILGRRSTAPLRTVGFDPRSTHNATGELISYSGDSHLITFCPYGHWEDLRSGHLQCLDASRSVNRY